MISTALPAGAWTTRPPAGFEKQAAPLAEVDSVRVIAKDLEYRRAQDAAQEASGQPGPARFATPVETELDLWNAGTWQTFDNDSRSWRLRIESPGALSLNLTLGAFDLAEGAGLWIYSPDRHQVQGPYERHHGNELGELFTSIILGPEIVVELNEPADVVGKSRLQISRVNHGYRQFGEVEKRGACNVDVLCPEGAPYADQIRSVAVYTVNGFFTCTGSLVNNVLQDGRPFFLTANHCSSTFPNMVIYWNFQMPTCGATSGASLSDSQSGATLLFSDFGSDAALLELDEVPPMAYNVYYAGWDATGDVPQSTVIIHHPSTDEKSISFDHHPPNPIDLFDIGEETVWQILDWDLGTTEPGSSGGPLFDQTSKLIKGTSFGGLAACGNDLEDWFGRVSSQFDAGMRAFLDPESTMAASLQGMDSGLIFADGFETGDSSAWSAAGQGRQTSNSQSPTDARLGEGSSRRRP